MPAIIMPPDSPFLDPHQQAEGAWPKDTLIEKAE
jgi:hypothetical protein